MLQFFRQFIFYLHERFILKLKAPDTTLAILVILTVQFFPLLAQLQNHEEYLRQIIKQQDVSELNRGKSDYYLVEVLPDIKHAELAETGVNIIRRVGLRLVIVRGTLHTLEQNGALVKDFKPVNDLWKLEPGLLSTDRSVPRQLILKTTAPEEVRQALSSVPDTRFVKVHHGFTSIYATLQTVLSHIITLDQVTYVGSESFAPTEESRVLDLYLSPNTVNKAHHMLPEINGAGTVISIRESSYDINDPDLKARHIPSALQADETSSHATEMATIAAGAGNTFINGRGVAWNAMITSSDFSDLFPDADNDYINLNAWVQNHAYGTEIENFYGALAESYDKNANALPELLHVFSSGNQGTSVSGEGAYAGIEGFANLTGNFKMSKNTISVGAVDTLYRPVFFSSRGPAYDGRIKPEIVAYSTQGSSNAAALVTGLASLVQQAHKEKENQLPPSALVKALLINSAQDAGTPGVDFLTGYGNVDAYRTLMNIQAGNYLSGEITNGGVVTFNLDIPAGAANVKVTLVWNDAAAEVNASHALVNDLDLKIENNETWLPWILDVSADKQKLSRAALRGADHLNNVEQITIENPPAGTHTVTVQGFDVLSGPQRFYIAYQWDTLNQFTWIFPTGSDNMPFDGETGTYFYWRSTLPHASGRLEYSVDGGATWIEIASTVDLKKGYFRWNNAPEITAIAEARLVIGAQAYVSEKFTISRPPPVSIGFNCADSVMLQWMAVEGADSYEIYTFKETMMQSLQLTSDTFLILNKEEAPSRLYAIQPVLEGGKKALRTPLFDYQLLGSECFLLSFTDEVVPDDGIYLNIQLGTTYAVSRLIIEHQREGVFTPIGNLIPSMKTLRFLHEHPDQGLNRYRLRIELANGSEVLSDEIENYFLTELPFLIFPNPVSRSGELAVFSKAFSTQDVTFSLYKSDGSLMIFTKLLSDREFIPVSHLAPGLYTYSITSEEGRFTGRIVVH